MVNHISNEQRNKQTKKRGQASAFETLSATEQLLETIAKLMKI